MIIFAIVDVVNTINFIQNFVNVLMQCIKIMHINFFSKKFQKTNQILRKIIENFRFQSC